MAWSVSMASQTARPLTIDGLSIAFDVMRDEGIVEETLQAIRTSGLSAINMTTPYPGDDFKVAIDKISRLQNIVHRNPDDLQIVRSTDDIDQCLRSGKLGVIIGFQSTEMFDESLSGISTFHGLGARIIQMSYNGPGIFGHGCLSEGDSGLTTTGFAAVEQLNETGLLIDASHANKATTADSIKSSDRPIIISHTGCNAIYHHPRSNDDAELRALAEKGGVAGMYLMPFLDGGTGELTNEMLFLHLEHALNVCGEDHVGIGSDQGVRPVEDGPDYRKRLKAEVERRKAAGISAPGESADRPPFIPALNRSDRLLEIRRLMTQRGHSSRVVDKVSGQNFYRVMKDVW
ncbi:MAG: membrane dipeptidase [bacterium]